jgi:small nuclear ribonucleoprotein (snRNP)-like protein
LIKKILAITLSALIFALSVSSTTAFAQTTATTADIEKVRSKVQTLSIDRDKQIEVKLRDNTKYKGHITAVEPDAFTLTESKTSRVQKFSYSEVEDVKRSGGGISSKTWLILGGAVAGGVATWLIVKPAVCDGGAQTRGIC